MSNTTHQDYKSNLDVIAMGIFTGETSHMNYLLMDSLENRDNVLTFEVLMSIVFAGCSILKIDPNSINQSKVDKINEYFGTTGYTFNYKLNNPNIVPYCKIITKYEDIWKNLDEKPFILNPFHPLLIFEDIEKPEIVKEHLMKDKYLKNIMALSENQDYLFYFTK